MNQKDSDKAEACIKEKKEQNTRSKECLNGIEKQTYPQENTSKQKAPITNKSSKKKKTELDKIDECIAKQKAKGLPAYKCVQK